MNSTGHLKVIAIYLPQFHPIPENNEWWGKGFTEWTNVTKAKPLFNGHYQPHLPADLGFYDLRLEESRLAQEELARKYGIQAFCFYHYWFSGKRILEEPLQRKLNNPKEDLPFMMCWANGSWTRTWDGNDNILLEQKYSCDDHVNHISVLIEYFKDERYLKIDNKPVFAICRSEDILDLVFFISGLKKCALDNGFNGVYFVKLEMFEEGKDPEEIGFDAAVSFQPNWRNNPNHLGRSLFNRFFRRGRYNYFIRNNVFDYSSYSSKNNSKRYGYNQFPCVMPGWDNSARKGKKNATIYINSNPNLFKNWISSILSKWIWNDPSTKILFINAWNEWAEGNHLEPCQKWGTKYLEVLKEEIDAFNNNL